MIQESYSHDRLFFKAARRPHLTPNLLFAGINEIAQLRADGEILRQFEPLLLKKGKKTVTRDRFVKRVNDAIWYPASKDETKLAVPGLSNDINYVAKWTDDEKRRSSVKKRYELAVAAYEDAISRKETLEGALDLDCPEPVLDLHKIRMAPGILGEFAKFSAERSALDSYKWKDIDLLREQRLWQVYLCMASDQMVGQAFEFLYGFNKNRARFWNNEVDLAGQNPFVSEIFLMPGMHMRKIHPRLAA